jgi:hypothetical protein
MTGAACHTKVVFRPPPCELVADQCREDFMDIE